MKIKKVDDKPMIIHTKAKTKIHVRGKPETKLKGRNVYTVSRSPKIKNAEVTYKKEKSKNVNCSTKAKNEVNKEKDNKKENVNAKSIKENNIRQKIKVKENRLKAAGVVGTSIVVNQLEGGDEIRDSICIAGAIANPLIKGGNVGIDLYRKQQATLAKRKARLKVRETKTDKEEKEKADTKKRESSQKNDAPRNNSEKEKAEKNVKKKKENGEGQKQTVDEKKAKRKSDKFHKKKSNSKSVGGGRKNKTNTKHLMMAQFLSQMRKQEEETGTEKLLTDGIKIKVNILMKQITAKVGGFLLFLFVLIALTCLPVVAVITVLYNSPAAIFLPTLEEGDTVMNVTSAYVSEFRQKIIDLEEEHEGCDEGRIVYVDYEGDGVPDNTYDIMMVYMVKYGIGDTATVMNEISKGWLREVFDDMCSYTTSKEVEEVEEIQIITDDDGKETEEIVTVSKTVFSVNITLKSSWDMIPIYHFDKEETELLEFLMNPEYLALLGYEGSGTSGISSLPEEEYEAVSDAIADARAKKAVSFALSKLGYPYSQPLRDSGTHYDCSSLVYYAWRSAGVNLSYGGANTAAQIGKRFDDLGRTVSYGEMKPGDLIFYSFGTNGRYKNIGHVAMYCGDGKLVDASSSRGKVVYRDVYSKGNIVLIGRP